MKCSRAFSVMYVHVFILPPVGEAVEGHSGCMEERGGEKAPLYVCG